MLQILALSMLLETGRHRPSPSALPASAQADSTPEAHVGKGYELEKDERFTNAAAEFEAALALDPSLPRARYQLGVCYFALGRDDDARLEFLQLESVAHDDPSVIYFLGRLDLADRDFDAAIRRLSRIVEQPPFPDTAYYLGSAYLEQGDLVKAERWLKAAERANQQDFRIPDHLGRVYQREGRARDATQAYTRAAGLRQQYNQAAADGMACSRDLESESARGETTEACDKLFQPNDPDRLSFLGMIYGRHGRYAEAASPLERAAELDPDSYEIDHNLGLTYFRLERYREALAPLERAVTLRPDFFESNALLGATLFMLKQDPRAYEVLRHAHELNPDDSDTAELLFKTASLLAMKSYDAKNYADTLKFLQQAEAVRPLDPRVHAQLADVYDRVGDRRQADAEKQIATRLEKAR
jgi:Flp pilus assembly protein TadD